MIHVALDTSGIGDKNLFYREISFFIHEVFKNYLQVKNKLTKITNHAKKFF